MKITVITVCLNSSETIEKTVQSVAAQEYPGLEYIVVDGGSTDGTLDILKKYDSSGMLIGEAPCTRDLISITNTDFQTVSVVSIGAIFIIILLVFKSISLPVILVTVIEFAIFTCLVDAEKRNMHLIFL